MSKTHCGRVEILEDGQKIKEQKVFQNGRYCQLCFENTCHIYVCGLFQVIRHISNGLYVNVCKLTSTCLPKMYDCQICDPA